jgi:hypothetical protein
MADEIKEPTIDPMAELKAQNALLLERLDKLEKLSTPTNVDKEPELHEKAKQYREVEDKKSNDSKALDAAIRFDLGAKDFLKAAGSILPKDVADIFSAADKENYSNTTEKVSAVKAGIIQNFFGVQSNLDLLTPAQKSSLDEYLKLTKNMKQEKAGAIYDSIFEPTLETLKRIRKAEALNGNWKDQSDSEKLLEERMTKLSRQHYLGEKNA